MRKISAAVNPIGVPSFKQSLLCAEENSQSFTTLFTSFCFSEVSSPKDQLYFPAVKQPREFSVFVFGNDQHQKSPNFRR